ncbi:MAG: cytochrome c biogenesis protein CcdA [Candidatus Marinimicrobia bacterium]|nr:cytochrome c biogenesis protein CcdA [Candidatus Neomarinimicrobiota bacterium]MCF7839860.1 cytochrome c biogenesis protein CcdA [Candidatus Neomarinimicrobiota bacterium]MCF7903447.1 cytochrome c biogenesis protein CcdA [Candidatus Neomarinimicrobiota bacterium]
MDALFTTLTQAMTASFGIALLAALGWGLLSILLSPCHLSSIPLVIGYISSQETTVTPRRSFHLALVFAVGILITIAIIGVVTASMGRLIGDVGPWGNWIVAAVFFLVGLYLLDIIKFSWSGPAMTTNRGGWTGALILGLVFGIGLGPCTFAYFAPILGVVFGVATSSWIKAGLLIAAFGIGHCAVIVGAGSLTHMVKKYLTWSSQSKTTVWIRRTAGVLVILGGVYFVITAM